MDRIEILRTYMGDREAVYITSYPNIFYYSGFTSEDAVLIISKTRKILFTDSRYTVQAKLEAEDFEVIDIISKKDDTIKGLDVEVLCIEEEDMSVGEFSLMQKYGLKLKPFSSEIKKPRQVKSEEEIIRLKNAQALGDEAFGYILNRIKTGISEREIALDLEMFMKRNGASSLSFDTICASGVRSCMPHGVASDKIIEKGDFVTLDFGCVLDGYCSDMTRTVVMGTPDEKQKEIYETVLLAQNNTLKMLREGVKCKDADYSARSVIEKAGYGNNFLHSTGHSVGVEIHETPNLSSKSEDILKKGNVVSVEPGIYIEGWGGVRIEDLVVITENGIENLTKSEKDLIII